MFGKVNKVITPFVAFFALIEREAAVSLDEFCVDSGMPTVYAVVYGFVGFVAVRVVVGENEFFVVAKVSSYDRHL